MTVLQQIQSVYNSAEQFLIPGDFRGAASVISNPRNSVAIVDAVLDMLTPAELSGVAPYIDLNKYGYKINTVSAPAPIVQTVSTPAPIPVYVAPVNPYPDLPPISYFKSLIATPGTSPATSGAYSVWQMLYGPGGWPDAEKQYVIGQLSASDLAAVAAAKQAYDNWDATRIAVAIATEPPAPVHNDPVPTTTPVLIGTNHITYSPASYAYSPPAPGYTNIGTQAAPVIVPVSTPVVAVTTSNAGTASNLVTAPVFVDTAPVSTGNAIVPASYIPPVIPTGYTMPFVPNAPGTPTYQIKADLAPPPGYVPFWNYYTPGHTMAPPANREVQATNPYIGPITDAINASNAANAFAASTGIPYTPSALTISHTGVPGYSIPKPIIQPVTPQSSYADNTKVYFGPAAYSGADYGAGYTGYGANYGTGSQSQQASNGQTIQSATGLSTPVILGIGAVVLMLAMRKGR